MPALRPIEGKKLVKILCNNFGFKAIRQKGSHVTLTNGALYVTVPVKEIRVGLLSVIFPLELVVLFEAPLCIQSHQRVSILQHAIQSASAEETHQVGQ